MVEIVSKKTVHWFGSSRISNKMINSGSPMRFAEIGNVDICMFCRESTSVYSPCFQTPGNARAHWIDLEFCHLLPSQVAIIMTENVLLNFCRSHHLSGDVD